MTVPRDRAAARDFRSNPVSDAPAPKTKEENAMKSNNNAVVPEAREALDKFKMEAASEVRVPMPS